jgi:hypothetical protein
MEVESLLTNIVQLHAIVEVFLYMRYRHVTYKNLLLVGDYAAQSRASPIYNGCTLSLLGLEDMLQRLQKLAPEPHHVHLLSYYMHEVVGLISFSATNCVVVATVEGLVLAITLSLVFSKRFSHFGIQYKAFKLSITSITPSIFYGNNTIFISIMAYDGDIYCEFRKHVAVVPCYDFSKMFVMCEIRPWELIDLTINLCKADVVIADKSHTKSFYEDVLVYMFIYFYPEQLNPLNQKLMNYGVLDSWLNSAINNFVGAWIAHSGYYDYHAADWQNC